MAVDPYGRRQPGARQQNQVPQNTRLWAMLQVQARQKFREYPSLPASKWIHSEYVKRGGVFVESKKKDTQHDKRGKMTAHGKKEKETEEKQKKTADRSTKRKPTGRKKK
jgi:hypothetical protein